MSKPPFNTNYDEHANARTRQRVEDNAFHLGAWWIGFSEDEAKAFAEGGSSAFKT